MKKSPTSTGAGSAWPRRAFPTWGLYAENGLEWLCAPCDLLDIRELVSLQQRCANNLNQVAIHVNTYGGIYSDEIKALQRDYADLGVSAVQFALLKKLPAVVEI